MSNATTETITGEREQIASLKALAMDPRLGAARIQVLEADTGRPLLERAAWRPAETASVMKTITCAIALHTLDPKSRIETRVMTGSAPGEVVLVGGGDVTLSRVPGEGPTYYRDPARLDDLAKRTLEALEGKAPTKIVLDDSLFAGGEWSDTEWLEEDRDPGGY
ncbi:MAG: D-alanyl-D-alanine carboxypeptidase, partial [Leucobacter sp.]